MKRPTMWHGVVTLVGICALVFLSAQALSAPVRASSPTQVQAHVALQSGDEQDSSNEDPFAPTRETLPGDQIDPVIDPGEPLSADASNASAGDNVDNSSDSPADACNNTIFNGFPLFRGQTRTSCNGRYTVAQLANGNAQVTMNIAGGIKLWNNGASGDAFGPDVTGVGGIVDNSALTLTTWRAIRGIYVARIVMLDDGNFVAYNGVNQPVWSTATNTFACAGGVTVNRNDEYDSLNRLKARGAPDAVLQDLANSPCTIPSSK